MKQKHFLIFGIVGVLVIIGITTIAFIKQNQTAPFCDKEENCCVKDEDCQYIWFAGGCYTPEYVSKVMEKCKDGNNPCPSEVPPKKNVTCICENNKCVTHN